MVVQDVKSRGLPRIFNRSYIPLYLILTGEGHQALPVQIYKSAENPCKLNPVKRLYFDDFIGWETIILEEIEQDAKWYTFPISGWFYRGKWSIWFKYDVSEVGDLTTLGDTFRAEKINAPLSIYFWQTCHLINKTLRSVSYFCHNIVVGINVSDLKAMIRFQEQLANPSRLPTKLKSPPCNMAITLSVHYHCCCNQLVSDEICGALLGLWFPPLPPMP